ncbi:MAG: hypothetical protein ABUL77_03715, partial [Bacteroidota bacterium]
GKLGNAAGVGAVAAGVGGAGGFAFAGAGASAARAAGGAGGVAAVPPVLVPGAWPDTGAHAPCDSAAITTITREIGFMDGFLEEAGVVKPSVF